MNKLNNKGFTLVEILAVISILALIIIIVATNGFGAFDNTKKKIFEETMVQIKESANFLMVEVVNCDDTFDKDSLLSIGEGTLLEINDINEQSCKALKTKANGDIDDDSVSCLNIPLEYLLKNNYISGSNAETIFVNNPNMVFKGCIEFEENDIEKEVKESKVECKADCEYKKDVTTTTSNTTTTESTTTTTKTTTQPIDPVCHDVPYSSTLKSLAFNIICNAKKAKEENSSTKTIYSETSLTKPAKEPNGENEKTLSIEEDDHGISYYFRGNVKDNYVNFAGMCWRIVRIEGDGSTKLILEDINEQCNNKNYTGNWSDGNKYEFRYFTKFLDSELFTSFKSFQENLSIKISSKFPGKTISDKLKIEEWCHDNVVQEEYFQDNPEGEVGLWYYDYYYGAYIRIIKNKKPELTCSGTKVTRFKDDTGMYVGTLTADEITYAGANYNEENHNFYLINNYTKDNSLSWWTLSPAQRQDRAIGQTVTAFGLYKGGKLADFWSVNIFYSRPAISLKSGTVILDGEGTLENPYIIG